MRNPPERYLQLLHEHFAHIPGLLTENLSVQEKNKNISQPSPFTTNQDGKGTSFQRWFRFKEAFSPTFVTTAIESLGFRPSHIADPFGGSGTSAITSQLLGIDATTIEVNPFLADLIRSKVSHLAAEALRCEAVAFQARLTRTRSSMVRLAHLPPTFIESEDKQRWIFPLQVAKRLSQYLLCIDAIEDTDVQRFFKVVLGAVLIDCSNVYVNGKGRRYRSAWQTNQPTSEKLDELFGMQFNAAFEDVLRFDDRPRSKIDVMHGDVRSAFELVNQPADLIVFSPPYPNSFDYTDIYNVELWVLGYLKSSQDNLCLRRDTLRSHVQIHGAYGMPLQKSDCLDATLADLHQQSEQLWDKSIPLMVGSYFHDMEIVLTQCQRLLTERGKVMMVVGDSRYAGVRIEVATIIADIARSMGFGYVVTREVRQMRASAQQGGRLQLAESIVELRL